MDQWATREGYWTPLWCLKHTSPRDGAIRKRTEPAGVVWPGATRRLQRAPSWRGTAHRPARNQSRRTRAEEPDPARIGPEESARDRQCRPPVC